MRKLLTAGIFGTILSLTGANYACASIISRGFFDEAMENYATNTALDLKANQTDLTALSNKIGDLPSGNFPDFPGYELIIPPLNQPLTYPTSLAELINAIYGNSETKEEGLLAAILSGIPSYSSEDPVGVIPNYNLAKIANNKIGTLPTETAMSSCSVWRAIDLTQNEMPETIGGILDQLYSAGHMNGSCDHDGYNGPSLPNIIRRLIYGYNYDGGTKMMGINGLNVGLTDSTGNVIDPGLRQITNGWTDAKGVIINPGLKAMFDGWTDSAGETYQGIKALNEGWTDENWRLAIPGIKGMFYGWTDKGGSSFPGLYSYSKGETLLQSAYNSGSDFSRLLINGANATTIRGVDYTGPVYPLWKLSEGIDKIGTLPEGITVQTMYEGWTDKSGFITNPGIKGMFDGWTDGNSKYPGLFNLSFDAMRITSYYGAPASSLLSNGIDKFTSPEYTGPIYPLWKLSQGIDQIGTLQIGNFPLFTGAESLFSEVAQPLTYPTSLAELINAIYGYGDAKTGRPGLLGSIFAGSPLDYDQDGRTDGYIGLIPNYQLAKTANDKIGTLPEGITLQGLYEQWNRDVSDFVSDLKSLWDPTNTKSILSGTDPNKFSNDIYSAFNATYIIFERIMSALSYGWRDIDTNTYYSGIIDLNEGWLDKSTNTTYQGIKALNEGWTDSNGTPHLGVKGLNDVIGTLPTQISGGNTVWARYGFETPIELPTTVGGIFDMLFYDERNSTEVRFSLSGIMGRILTGLYKDDGSVSFHGLTDLTNALELRGDTNYPLVNAVNTNTAAIEKIGTVPDGKNLAGMISETDAKIGTVPAGYDNVGAALSAIDSKMAAKDLPSTSDDGQYVLTAKKVGETITYTWVKMDLTTEEQGQ